MSFKKIGGGTAVVLSAVLAVSSLPFSSITAFAEDTDLTGNTMLTADELKLDKVVSGEIVKYDSDWYSFVLAEPSKVNVVCQGTANQFGFALYDGSEDNNVLYNPSASKSVVNTLYLKAGTYYINVFESYYFETPYDLKVSATPSELNVDGNGGNNTLTKAAAVEFGTEYNAQISLNDSIDYYTFDVPADASVTFNFVGGMDTVDWSLYDNQDDLIKHGTYQKDDADDDEISSRNSLVLKEGKYTVALSTNDNAPSYGQYSFSFDYREDYNDVAANGIIAVGDVNADGSIDAKDASLTLVFYAYLSSGGTETDMNKWRATLSN